MVLHSFAELGEAFGIASKPRRPRVYHCKKCGSEMTRIEGTNVFFCHGKTDEGEPCTNRMILPSLAN